MSPHGHCQLNKSCDMQMSHVTVEWVMSRMNESCHVWMSHVTNEWVMSYGYVSCDMRMSYVTYNRCTSRIKEPCHLIGTATQPNPRQTRTSHLTSTSHVTYERFMLPDWRCHPRQAWGRREEQVSIWYLLAAYWKRAWAALLLRLSESIFFQ
jgi:hypothetical protein